MKFVLAYGAVIVLANFWHFLGTLLVTFPVAGCLAKASQHLRGVVAGVLSGLGGVAASVAFGYFTFRLIFDSTAFTAFPLLAATVPLAIPIRKDFAQSRLLFSDVTRLGEHLQTQVATIQEKKVFEDVAPVDMAVGSRFRAVGTILGIVLAFIWLLFVRENAA